MQEIWLVSSETYFSGRQIFKKSTDFPLNFWLHPPHKTRRKNLRSPRIMELRVDNYFDSFDHGKLPEKWPLHLHEKICYS